MPLRNVIVNVSAAITISVAGALCAQPAPEEVAAAEQAAAAAQAYARTKMDEATSADDRFHTNRTEANMHARDKAEAEAAEAIAQAHAAMDRANAVKDAARAEGEGAGPAAGAESGAPQ